MIPTRERPRELARALASVLAQGDAAFEVIVVDDASGDAAAAAEVIADAADPRARSYRLPRQGGPAVARNAGLAAARGEWVAFLDDDDEWGPGKLNAQLEALAASGAGWCWCAALLVDEDGRRLSDDPAPPAERLDALLRVSNAVPGSASSVIARRELLVDFGGFDERFAHLADWELWIRLADAAPGASCPEALVTQRIHPDGMHASDPGAAIREFALLRREHPGIHGGEFMLWVAKAHRRAGRRWRALWALARARLG